MKHKLLQAGRLAWIDCLKGLAILLVIWGHTQHESPLNTWIQSFHVSIFLVVSGYLYAEQNKTIKSFDRTVHKLIKPYLIFSVFALLMNALTGSLTSVNVRKNAVIDIYKTISLYGIHAIWYLPSYAIATYIVLKADSQVKRVIVFIINIAVSIIGNYFFMWIESHQFVIAKSILYYPLSCFISGEACAAIMIVGYRMSIYLKS